MCEPGVENEASAAAAGDTDTATKPTATKLRDAPSEMILREKVEVRVGRVMCQQISTAPLTNNLESRQIGTFVCAIFAQIAATNSIAPKELLANIC